MSVERPEESNCPSCSEEPTDESVVEVRLSDLGYTHGDVILECSACGNQWTCGVPIGEPEVETDLWCDSCDSGYMRTHFVDTNPAIEADIKLHLKCPNCYHYKWVSRDTDRREVFLTGYPDITGETGHENHGYPEAGFSTEASADD